MILRNVIKYPCDHFVILITIFKHSVSITTTQHNQAVLIPRQRGVIPYCFSMSPAWRKSVKISPLKHEKERVQHENIGLRNLCYSFAS